MVLQIIEPEFKAVLLALKGHRDCIQCLARRLLQLLLLLLVVLIEYAPLGNDVPLVLLKVTDVLQLQRLRGDGGELARFLRGHQNDVLVANAALDFELAWAGG